ncbi:bZIP transcription factor [Apiospora marii]|uniref:BZIP transcription factor n=1 Tax=Apiospora marii TaxID=335849 RepID=A0ABR1SG17_9PEZI
MSADHMNYFNTNDFGPPTASSGGYYSLDDDQYDYSFPASQNIEQYNLPHQFGPSATNLSHQVNQALSQHQQQQQLSPTATHAGTGQGLGGHAYFSGHGSTAPHVDYDHSSHGESPVDLNEDQEAALNALRSQGRIGSSSDLGSSISVLEVTTAARGQRHERNREKNRLAASKCREKSKKYVDELRERERELAAQRASLSQHAASLREEVLWLKNEILRHGDCNCEFIQNYLATAARQIT